MITIKRIIKRILALILVCTIFTCAMFKREEKQVQAVAGVDDVCIGLLIIAAGAVYGEYKYLEKNGSVVEAFKDCFGGLTYDNLCAYFNSIDIEEAGIAIHSVEISNSSLASAARKIKAQYKFPVEQTAEGTFKTYNLNGLVVEAANLSDFIKQNIFNARQYYMVESLDSCPFTVNTSGEAVIKQDVYDDISNAVKSVTKKVVNLGKGVVSWLLDAAKATAVDSVAAVSDSYYDKFGEGYRDSMYSIHGDATTFYLESFGIGLSLNGVLLELHAGDSVYYGTFKADFFETLNNSYAEIGDISIFTNSMATSYTLYNPFDYIDGSYRVTNNTNGGVISGGDSYSSVSLSYSGSASATVVTTNTHYQSASDAITGDKVHIINNGNTANYVIGTVGADGTISYDVVGESSTVFFADTIVKGSTGIEVAGDIVVNDDILAGAVDGSLSVEKLNNRVAAINDSVTAIDTTLEDGFKDSSNWLSKIWTLLSEFPGLIVSFFDTLFDYLSRILGGILDIVSNLKAVKNAILDIPGSIADVFVDVKDGILAIPSRLIELLKELLIALFVPSDTFFNDWKNKFDDKLRDKLPYATYNDFFENIKTISNSRLEDIKVTIFGTECTVLTFQWYYAYEDSINGFIRGVMFFVLIFYNINMMYKLIRGTSLYKLDKYMSAVDVKEEKE